MLTQPIDYFLVVWFCDAERTLFSRDRGSLRVIRGVVRQRCRWQSNERGHGSGADKAGSHG